MPLPTTVTTAKQTAAKAAKTRKINREQQLADEAATSITPKVTAGKVHTIPDSEVSAEILQHFHDLGMGRDEIRACAGQWLVTQAEVQQWEAKLNTADEQERERIDLETAKAAAQINACILQHGHVRTDAIRIATPDKLLDYIDYYEQELDDLYPHIHDEHHQDWAENNRDWNRLNTYLWECKVMAGLTPVTLQVLTNQNLEATLDQALEEAKPETKRGAA